jgi:hypothetical protein
MFLDVVRLLAVAWSVAAITSLAIIELRPAYDPASVVLAQYATGLLSTLTITRRRLASGHYDQKAGR